MTTEKDAAENSSDTASLLLRLPAPLKAELAEAASRNRRSLTAEILVRLASSLTQEQQAGDSPATAPAAGYSHAANALVSGDENDFEVREQPGLPYAAQAAKSKVTDPAVVAALQAIFLRLPVEKQLAFMTLLR